jgi:hypothetical protein
MRARRALSVCEIEETHILEIFPPGWPPLGSKLRTRDCPAGQSEYRVLTNDPHSTYRRPWSPGLGKARHLLVIQNRRLAARPHQGMGRQQWRRRQWHKSKPALHTHTGTVVERSAGFDTDGPL